MVLGALATPTDETVRSSQISKPAWSGFYPLALRRLAHRLPLKRPDLWRSTAFRGMGGFWREAALLRLEVAVAIRGTRLERDPRTLAPPSSVSTSPPRHRSKPVSPGDSRAFEGERIRLLERGLGEKGERDQGVGKVRFYCWKQYSRCTVEQFDATTTEGQGPTARASVTSPCASTAQR